MAFSTLTFLVFFLPVSLSGYYLFNDKIKTVFLLVISIFFYAFGGFQSLPILVGSILFNYFIALIMDRVCKTKNTKKIIMITAVTANVGLLLSYKYLPSMLSTVNEWLGLEINAPSWALPLGISFYTFSTISYILDIYFGTAKSEKNILNVALFIVFFPKMMSGPIVKWDSFQTQLASCKFSVNGFSDGIVRFIVGLGKKVIIADTIGVVADYAFNCEDFSHLSVMMAWIGVLAYLVQLYFDFSGYSDMAVGLGMMFGFKFDENFNYPYCAKNVAEFWAKWHITLGTWLKHYLYTPIFRSLSKKKKKNGKKRFSIMVCDTVSLFVTWVVIGCWHGADVKFLIYGLYYFVFIILERNYDNYKKKRAKSGNPIKPNFFNNHILTHIYLLAVVAFGQLLFRANSLSSAINYCGAMFGLAGNALVDDYSMLYGIEYLLTFIVAIVFSTPILKKVSQWSERYLVINRIQNVIVPLFCMLILILAVGHMSVTTYNPFIYLNF